MAIVRCEKHPIHLTQATNKYVKRVEPLGRYKPCTCSKSTFTSDIHKWTRSLTVPCVKQMLASYRSSIWDWSGV